MRTITLNEMRFENDSVFADTLDVLVTDGTLADLVTWLYDSCFCSWGVEPDFTIEQLFSHLKNEWVQTGGEIGQL